MGNKESGESIASINFSIKPGFVGADSRSTFKSQPRSCLILSDLTIDSDYPSYKPTRGDH